MAGDDGWAGRSKLKIDVAGDDFAHRIGAPLRPAPSVDRLWMGRAGFRVEAGQLQHLVDELGGTTGPLCSCCGDAVALIVIAGVGRPAVGPTAQPAGIMRSSCDGIGGETAFGLDGFSTRWNRP